jgi:hypothetical protein
MPPALSHQTYWYLRSRLSQRGDVIMIERAAQLDELCAVVGLLGRAIPGGVREASPSWRGSSRPCPLSAASAGVGGSGRTLVLRKAGRIPEGAEPLYTAQDAPAVTEPTTAIGVPGAPPFVRGSNTAGHVPTGWDLRQRHAGLHAERSPPVTR